MQRAKLLGKAQIVVGDTTSHGGRVISGSPSSTWSAANIPIARKGDQVTCPLCAPHLFEIAEGLEGCEDFGQLMAIEGHKTTCGAILIARPAPAED
ncbi:putative Zn-binding protein involved in type VI secretion [Paraburkholderia bannensis]|uniref:Putative Zn-binding protein involved in type VI secretion n=1 Tax=Paraburkholderia bannensis TaxID=765414 RepID=A0A7W9WRU1_9BURK|nr:MULTISPECIES: PAAR domain-containing protein [Paraburkholderia]MBB3256008.1 putative Zn-binding protein involved in type VI secretion [Paraburkholderia sp. WP4_3_2]MBB6101008.1 putative Zn-binding protein involved in type VI secretion [Paraburkholderia bannensis]